MYEYHVFLSHSSKDDDLAANVASLLQKEDFKVFTTRPGHPKGIWPDEVRNALEQSEEIWPLLTEHGLSSVYVQHEFGYFYGYLRRKMASTDVRFVGNRLKPVARKGLEDLPGMYQHVQAIWVDGFEPDQIADLIKANFGSGRERWDGRTPPRELMKAQRYEVAVDAYTRMMELDSNLHSLYVGRAEAKAHLGDVEGAWEDYAVAKRLNPSGRDFLKLERMLQSGELEPRSGGRPLYQGDLDQGNSRLANGEWQEALVAYKRAAYKRADKYGPFLLHNAMAFLCGSDTKSARASLEKLEDSRQDPGERVVSWALKAIAYALDSQDDQGIWTHLQDAKVMCPGFSARTSEIRHLEAGMAVTGILFRNDGVLRVFKALPYSRSAAM